MKDDAVLTRRATPIGRLLLVQGAEGVVRIGFEEAGTSGSQFFVVTGEDAGLSPDFALVGEVTGGQEVVDRIGVVPTDGGGMPVAPIVIESVSVEVS